MAPKNSPCTCILRFGKTQETYLLTRTVGKVPGQILTHAGSMSPMASDAIGDIDPACVRIWPGTFPTVRVNRYVSWVFPNLKMQVHGEFLGAIRGSTSGDTYRRSCGNKLCRLHLNCGQ